MKKTFYYYTSMMLCMCLALVSCSDDEVSASQTLSVAAFSPSVVMEGTEVTVTGTALTGVTDVVFPGGVSAAQITIVDDRMLTAVAPAGVSTEEGTLTLKSADATVESRQKLHRANPAFGSYSYSDDEGAVTGSDLTIQGSDLLLVESVSLALEDVTVGIAALDMLRKSNDAIKFTIPEDAPVGAGVAVTLTFKNQSVMQLPAIEVKEGTGGGHWAEREVALYEGDPYVIDSWNSLQISGSKLGSVKADDVVRVYISDVQGGAQGSLKYTGDGWPGLSDELEYFDLTDDEKNAGYYMRTLTEEMVTRLQGNDLIISGQKYTIVKVSLFTSVWVEDKDDDREPVAADAIMLNNYEDSGNHNSSWDGSWTGGVELEFPTEADGNVYLYLKTPAEGEMWLTNCNHFNWGTVHNIENYAVKFDLKIEKGVTGASKAAMQYVIGGKWIWVGEGFFPESTNGKWMTVSRNLSEISDLTGDLVINSSESGLYGSGIPAGICIDNYRLELK